MKSRVTCTKTRKLFSQTSRYLRPPLVLDEDLPSSKFPSPSSKLDSTKQYKSRDTEVIVELPAKEIGKKVLFFAAKPEQGLKSEPPSESVAYGDYSNSGVTKVKFSGRGGVLHGVVKLKIDQPTVYKIGKRVFPPHVHFTLEDKRTGGWRKRLRTALVYRHICHAPASVRKAALSKASGDKNSRNKTSGDKNTPTVVFSKKGYDTAVSRKHMNVYLYR